MFKSAIPVLHVSGAAAAEEFYCDRLGFCRQFVYRVDETRPDPCYMGLARDGVELHISSFPADGVSGGVDFLLVEDVDALPAELVEKGAPVALEPTEQTWGNRARDVGAPAGTGIRCAHGGS